MRPRHDHVTPVALVTGGSGALGEAIALSLAKEGYTVAVNYLSSEARAFDVALRAGGRSFAVGADVRDSIEVSSMLRRIDNECGRLDAVINNAGITRDALLLRQTEKEWDEIIGCNLKGCFNVTKGSAELLHRSGGGHIVNISSYSGIKGKAGQAAYSASKAALIGLTYSSATELAHLNVRVNALLPGYLSAGMGSKIRAREDAEHESLLDKLSRPEEVALFIAALLRTENVTGQVLRLDSRII